MHVIEKFLMVLSYLIPEMHVIILFSFRIQKYLILKYMKP